MIFRFETDSVTHSSWTLCTPCTCSMKRSNLNLSIPHNDSYIQQSKCSHGFKNKINIELRKMTETLPFNQINTYPYTHLGQFSSVIFIQLKLTYVHKTFLCIPRILSYNGNLHTRFIRYNNYQQQIDNNNPFWEILQSYIQRASLRAFPPTDLHYIKWN